MLLILRRKCSIDPKFNNLYVHIQSTIPFFRPASSSNTVMFVPTKRKSSSLVPEKASADYIRRLNIGLNFTKEVVCESAPAALRFDQIRPRDIFSAPKSLLSQKRNSTNKGVQGRHNAIGDPIAHLPCSLSIPDASAELRRTKAFPVKPFLKKVVCFQQIIEDKAFIFEPLKAHSDILSSILL